MHLELAGKAVDVNGYVCAVLQVVMLAATCLGFNEQTGSERGLGVG